MATRCEIARLRQEIKCTGEQLSEALNELTQAVSNGFAKLDNLQQTLDQSGRDLTESVHQVRRAQEEATRVRAEAEAAHTEAAKGTAPTAFDRQGYGADASDREQLDRFLGLAAGIAYAELVCHRDIWDWLVAEAARGEHFRLPGDVAETDEGLIEADLSGRTLIAVLEALWAKQHDQDAARGTHHIATRIYDRIGDALKRIGPDGCPPQAGVTPPHPEDAPSGPTVVRIVIDDRPKPTGPSAGTCTPHPTE